jgi:hypothetical protein
MNKRQAISDFFTAPLLLIDPGEAIKVAIEKNEQEILDLNRQQLDQGRDANGKSLGRYKNFKYKNRYQPVDLKLTGEFRRKFTIGVDETKTEFFSQDFKEDKLVKRYGKAIHGIQQQLLPNMVEIIRPDIGNEVKKQVSG